MDALGPEAEIIRLIYFAGPQFASDLAGRWEGKVRSLFTHLLCFQGGIKVSESAASKQNINPVAATERESTAFIYSRDTLDGAYPSLILAINAGRLGIKPTIFYTFMGINVIRRGRAAKCRFVPEGTLRAIPGMSFACKLDDAEKNLRGRHSCARRIDSGGQVEV